MVTHVDGSGSTRNQERLRAKLKAETLARRLADAYDPAHTDEINGDALRQVIERELDKVRRSLEQDEDQVS
jgi:hypothetical protein